ncbi:hypothetical protein WJX75_001886 [Coccomyxa subellipsoidea]|uniref:F-box domain-containing protein n=1 Tax=Coccomyxa subellipsoidea TaxID=248742 RepID=A0ABR2YDI9_9CHLO
MESSKEVILVRQASGKRKHPSGQQAEGGLPTLPADVLRKVLELVAREWRGRRVQLAKEEVREWTQYCLVSREWRAAFQALPLCVVFDEAPSRRQVLAMPLKVLAHPAPEDLAIVRFFHE